VTGHGHSDPAALVPLDRYRRDVLSRVEPLDPIALGLLEARGCVLAEDVVADRDLPPFANSAMDGLRQTIRVAIDTEFG
jgi:molybdopterin molybdotransferase